MRAIVRIPESARERGEGTKTAEYLMQRVYQDGHVRLTGIAGTDEYGERPQVHLSIGDWTEIAYSDLNIIPRTVLPMFNGVPAIAHGSRIVPPLQSELR